MAVEGYRLAETLEARSAALSYLQTNAGLPKLLDGHPRSVNDIAFSADSKSSLRGGSDGVVRGDVAEGDTIGAPSGRVCPSSTTSPSRGSCSRSPVRS